MTLVVGLLGGIGSGKSAAAQAFADRGARVINADALGHEALRQPAVRDAVVARWGEGVLEERPVGKRDPSTADTAVARDNQNRHASTADTAVARDNQEVPRLCQPCSEAPEQRHIDRRKLAAIVFQQDGARRELEALTHPHIRRRAEEEVARARREQAPLVVVDAAVLLEAGWHTVCDKLVYVEAPPEVRLARVTGKRGWSRADWEAREQAQLPLTRKYARADHVLDNSSTLEHLNRQVDDLMCRWGLAPVQACPSETPPDTILHSSPSSD